MMMTDSAARPKVTQELISREVRRFWDSISAKDPQALMEFYAHECSVFGSFSTRAEPGRLAATRREREYFGAQTVVRVQTGPIDVLLLADGVAVASYNFELHASNVALVSNSEEHVAHGRATQVFAYDQDGRLRIFHEHLSVPAK